MILYPVLTFEWYVGTQSNKFKNNLCFIGISFAQNDLYLRRLVAMFKGN